ncbi:Uncharacterised protein [Shigella sonnei]|nr:Uncharacterised protein [Shigella sonnei]
MLGDFGCRNGVIQGRENAHLMNGGGRRVTALHFQQYRFHHLFNILLIHDVLPYLWKIT